MPFVPILHYGDNGMYWYGLSRHNEKRLPVMQVQTADQVVASWNFYRASRAIERPREDAQVEVES